MILEAFAKTLKRCFTREDRATELLQLWLLWHLESDSTPACSETQQVQNVIRTEIELVSASPVLAFQGKSPSGDVLLKSLYEYCLSFEDWQYRRWLHHIKASDFMTERSI